MVSVCTRHLWEVVFDIKSYEMFLIYAVICSYPACAVIRTYLSPKQQLDNIIPIKNG